MVAVMVLSFLGLRFSSFRHPEVPASSRASKGDGPGAGAVHPSRAAQERARPPQDDGIWMGADSTAHAAYSLASRFRDHMSCGPNGPSYMSQDAAGGGIVM